MPDALTFLPGLGFRPPGTRLAHPITIARDGLTLTVREVVCTSEGTDLVYEISDATVDAARGVPGPRPSRLESIEEIRLRAGDHEHRAHVMATSSRVIAGGVRRVLRADPVPNDLAPIELRLSGGAFGDWSVPLDLVPFGAGEVGRLQAFEAAASREGVTVRVSGITATSTTTAIRLDIEDGRGRWIAGIGGLHGMRRGPTSIGLRDEHQRMYSEVPSDEAAHAMGRAHFAVFEPLAADARELELEVPFVFVRDTDATVTVRLPVVEPMSASLGPYPIRVTSVGEAPDSPRRRNFGPALSIALDLGAWHGDRRVLFPSRVLVDGVDRGSGYGNGINATDPQPVDTIEVRMPDPTAAQEITLTGATVQIRGPWRVSFARP